MALDEGGNEWLVSLDLLALLRTEAYRYSTWSGRTRQSSTRVKTILLGDHM